MTEYMASERYKSYSPAKNVVPDPTENEYIPSTILYKATTPSSYYIEAQGKHFHRTRQHTRPIHLNLPQSATKLPVKTSNPATSPSLTPTLIQSPSLKGQTPHLNLLHCPTAIFLNPYNPPGLYPNQVLNLLTPLVSSNYYNTSTPSMALPIVPLTHVFPRPMSFPQKLG